jgi:hypothetical protein
MAKSIYWLLPEHQLSAEGDPNDIINVTDSNVALARCSTYVNANPDSWWSVGIPPLRMLQRDDALGKVGSAGPRITSGQGGQSVQSAKNPRIKTGEGQTYV